MPINPFFRRRIRFVRRRRYPSRRYPMTARRGLVRFGRQKPEINYKEFVMADAFYGAAGTALSTVPEVWNTNDDVAGGNLLNPPNLTRISVGANQNERIGRKVLIKSIQMRCVIFTQPLYSEPATPFHVHLSLVRFRNQQGRVPTGPDIWRQINTVGPPATFTTYAPIRNQDHLRDYEVIFTKKKFVKVDWEFRTTGGTDDAVGGQCRLQWDIYKKFKKPLLVNYYANNTNPTSSSIEQGGLYLFVWATNDTNTTTYLTSGFTMIKFLDM